MSSTFLLYLEDEGMCVLLGLKDLIDDMMKCHSNSLETAEGRPRSVTYSQPSLAVGTTQNFNKKVNTETSLYDNKANQVAGPEMPDGPNSVMAMVPHHTAPAVTCTHLYTQQQPSQSTYHLPTGAIA